MTRDEIEAFFAARQAEWRARNPRALAALHAPDGIVFSPMFGELHGSQAIADSYAALFRSFPDWDFVSQELLVDGDRVAEHFTATATHVGEFMGLAGTHRQAKIEGVRLCEMKDGFVQRERRIYDFSALLIQIGVLKTKPGF